MSHDSANGYSASVEIWLHVNDRCLSVAQVGDDSLLLRTPAEFLSASQYGRIIVTIDGEDHAYPVVIRSCRGRLIEFDHQPADAEQGLLFS